VQKTEDGISFIIPWGRKEPLGKVIKSILSLNGLTDKFEIIVVANHSDIEVPFHTENLRVVKCDRISAAYARNFGFQQATFDQLIFLDASVILDKFWLESVSKLINLPGVMLCGGTVINPMHPIHKLGSVNNYGGVEMLRCSTAPFIRFDTAAFWITRELFHSLGGFDQNLFRLEDTDLATRACLLGAGIASAASAVIKEEESKLDELEQNIILQHETLANEILLEKFSNHPLSLPVNPRLGRWRWHCSFTYRDTLFTLKSNVRVLHFEDEVHFVNFHPPHNVLKLEMADRINWLDHLKRSIEKKEILELNDAELREKLLKIYRQH
jgi:glycosyltransferase involved in cell wall biosynthesis